MLTRRRALGLLGGGAIASLAAGGAAAATPFLDPAIVRWRPEPPGWPQDLPLRIVAVSDPHVAPPYMTLDRLEGIVEQANALAPDLIVLLGDYGSAISWAPSPPAADIARRLAALRAPLGVWAVLGNHDWWSDPEAMARRAGPPRWRRALEDAGIPVLSNAAARLRLHGRGFWLAGLESQSAFGIVNAGGAHDAARTLAPMQGDDDPAILLAHEPNIFKRGLTRPALILSGHTHGGQVRVAGWSPVLPWGLDNRLAYGLVSDGPRRMVISGGLGCAKLPVRFGVRPELTVIELGA